MKRVFSIFLVLTLVVALAVPAFAADNFVDSVSKKTAPEIVTVKNEKGEAVAGVMTDASGKEVGSVAPEAVTQVAVSDAAEGSELKTLQVALNKEMPKEGLVVADLFDVSVDDAAAAILAADGVTIDLTFKVSRADAIVSVMTYNDGKWSEIKAFKNNGDGTITCTFEHFCPVMFAVDAGNKPVHTGDAMGNSLILWGAVLVVSAAAVVTLVVTRRKNAAQ